MRRGPLLRALLPPFVAAAMAVGLATPYTHALAAGRDAIVQVAPPSEAPLAVQVLGARTRVVARTQTRLVRTAAVAWNLPVLACLWAWVVGSRWRTLAVVASVLVAAHVVVYDLEVRSVSETASGWVYAVPRAWRLFLAALVPVVAVAAGWVARRPRPDPRGPAAAPLA